MTTVPDLSSEMARRILSEAKKAFSAGGYNGTSLRNVATAVGCDVALVPYYYGSKAELFRRCIQDAVDQGATIPSVEQAGPDRAADVMTRSLVRLWDDGPLSDALPAILRSAATPASTDPAIHEFVTDQMQRLYDEAIGLDGERAERLPNYLFAVTVTGTYILRSVVKLEPLASMDEDQLTALLAPELQSLVEFDAERTAVARGGAPD